MKKKQWGFRIVILLILLFSGLEYCFGWGFFSHRLINRMAVFSLPDKDLLRFYKRYIDYIEAHAVDPDRLRYVIPDEGSKHFIDLDIFPGHCIDSLPETWHEAMDKYGESFLIKEGMLPWSIQNTLRNLTKAFEDGNIKIILRLSAFIGHYVADACVPLHTTSNYNGKYTDQPGIHGLWESQMPFMFARKYDFIKGKAYYLSDPSSMIWDIIRESNTAVDSVFIMDKQIRDSLSFSYESVKKSTPVIKRFPKEYAKAYNNKLEGMIERRMQRAVKAVSCFWYTAWINAGKPHLDSLDLDITQDKLIKSLKKQKN